MTLVIKSNTVAPVGAKKLYGDALVANGTLQLVDFSNRGCLDNFSVANGAIVYNLAKLSGDGLNVVGSGVVNTLSDTVLTTGRGFAPVTVPSGGGQGMLFDVSILKYLYDNQGTHKFLFTFWMRAKDVDFVSGQLFRSLKGTTYTYTDIRANISAIKFLTVTFGGGGNGTLNIEATKGLVQVGVQFNGIGVPPTFYRNGSYLGEGTTNATGFGNVSNMFGIGKLENQPATTAPIYRWMIEDLTVSGRLSGNVVQDDYAYVNAIGKYTGIVKRPFVDLY